jgi:AAA+ superfamily predicted ATPase
MNPDNNLTNPQSPQPTIVNYKYRDIKVHSSDEWMADSTKRYRRVYDRYETTYIRVEFSFFNKLFDEADWEGTFIVKCFFLNGSNKTELCSLGDKRKVSKEENVVYIRNAWGNTQQGAYWLRGDYVWEGYIDGVKVGESKFYVEDMGVAKEGENLFFDIDSIKLFEGAGQAHLDATKKYLTKFKQADTRYVWCEFKLKNKTPKDYYAEIFFNFYNDAGQLKGTHSYLQFIALNTQGQVYTLFPGWGGETPGRWSNDFYTMEVVFLDKLIATVPFEVGADWGEGEASVITDPNEAIFKQVKVGAPAAAQNQDQDPDKQINEALAELNALTGLTQIKAEVNEMVQLVRFYQETGKDVLSKFSLHTVFTGNPGTGKTTVARIMAKIYKGLSILEKGHLVEVDREGLVAGYVGQTAIKTAEKVTEALGGILFIDEAYSLAAERGSNYDFGGEAIQIILKRMEDQRGKFGVIVAGYTDNMQDFISSNPGLRSRFDKYFEFPDYSPFEMFTIAQGLFDKEGVRLDEQARAHLYEYFNFIHERRDKHFGNARTVRQVVGESIKNQHLRLAAMKKEDRVGEVMELVILNDVKEFEMKETRNARTTIGFHPTGQQ